MVPRPCRFFNTAQGCRKGQRCDFAHDNPGTAAAGRAAAASAQRSTANSTSRRGALPAAVDSTRSFGSLAPRTSAAGCNAGQHQAHAPALQSDPKSVFRRQLRRCVFVSICCTERVALATSSKLVRTSRQMVALRAGACGQTLLRLSSSCARGLCYVAYDIMSALVI